MTYHVTVQIHFCYGHRPRLRRRVRASPRPQRPRRDRARVRSARRPRHGVRLRRRQRDVKAWIDATMDHQMILRKDDPLVEWLEAPRTLHDARRQPHGREHRACDIRSREGRGIPGGVGAVVGDARPTPRIAARLEGSGDPKLRLISWKRGSERRGSSKGSITICQAWGRWPSITRFKWSNASSGRPS